jgi:hypothetical protein
MNPYEEFGYAMNFGNGLTIGLPRYNEQSQRGR